LQLHEAAGYVGLFAVVARFVWGWCGSPFARFGQFLRAPPVVWRYAGDVARRSERRYLGHNPLGGWMVVMLLFGVLALGITGWLYTLDMFWGMAWLEWLHRALAWMLIGLIVLHVGGVLFTSRRHRENLVAAMITGYKKPPGGDDVS
jgi:cytochrome b